jgi:molybdate transport system ATP-binding protein
MLLRCRIPLAEFELDIDTSFDARVTSLFGPSGAGKTTLLDAIAGLKNVSWGEIEVGGRILLSSAQGIDLSPQERAVGYVPQEGALFPHLSVRKNILFGANRDRSVGAADGITLDHVLEVLEISAFLDRPVTRLSGGELQRVALARAILSRPRLLLLDEPLAALDIGLKERILPYLGRVRDEFSIPMIYVTHNVTEVLTLADWVLMIRQGRIVAQGVPREVLRSTQAIAQMEENEVENVFAASLSDSDRESGTSRVRFESGQELFIPYVSHRPGESLQIRINGDDILVATKPPEGISAGNIIKGQILRIDTFDGQSILRVAAGEVFVVRLTAGAVARLRLTEGQEVFLIIKTRSCEIF